MDPKLLNGSVRLEMAHAKWGFRISIHHFVTFIRDKTHLKHVIQNDSNVLKCLQTFGGPCMACSVLYVFSVQSSTRVLFTGQ